MEEIRIDRVTRNGIGSGLGRNEGVERATKDSRRLYRVDHVRRRNSFYDF
jgi:hypothetical protein